jgi:hypothetical protein
VSPGYEIIDQLMQAGLTAEMLGPWTQPVARIQPAHPQLSALVIGHIPVVGLLLLGSADVARYCLPDHRISLSPHSRSAALSIPFFFPSL